MSAGLLPPSLTSIFERNQEATCYIGNLDARVNEEILWELFIQCGPVVNVHIPRDKIIAEHQGFGFVEFRNEDDADYAIKIMHMIKLCGKPIKVNKASQDKRTQEVGANVFVGNLSEEVDEKGLKDIFSAFGVVLSTKIMRDPESGSSKRYGFVSFDNFDSSDEAMKKMNGQYISGKPIDVTYAYKKDTKGDRHGSVAERILAANRPNNLYTPILGDNSTLGSMGSMMNNNFAMNPMMMDINPPVGVLQMNIPHLMQPMNKFPQQPMGIMPNFPPNLPNMPPPNFIPNMNMNMNMKPMAPPQFPPMNMPMFNPGMHMIRPPPMMPPPK
jgi:splicing factor 3B subunit 4